MPRNTKTLTLDEALNIIKDIILEAKKDKKGTHLVAVVDSMAL